MDDLHYEQTDYQRVLNECSEQLDAIERYTEKVDTYGNPNPTQTAVCCDILRKLQLNVGRFHKSFQPLIHELASSIYSGYPENLQVNQRQQKPASVDGKIAYSTINTIKDALASSASLSSSPPAPVVPYFELARREQVKMKKLSNMIDELTIKRSEMERQESGRIHMLNALARRWQVSLMILSFSRWKKNVQKIKSQRQGFENVSRRSKIARLRALFLQWQTSIISEKRQHLQMRNTRLQNANKLLRNSLDEHMGVLQMSNDRQTMLGDKLAQLMEDKSGYRRKVRDLQAELKGMASSAITRLTSTTLDVLLQGLNSLMIELVAARELKIEDPCQLLSKDNSEFVIAFHGDDPAVYNIDTGSAEWAMKRHTEVVRARNKLRSFSESDIVLLWMNYHLRRAEADYSAKEARGLAEKEAESRISSKAEEHSPHHHEAYHGHHPQSTLTKKSGKKHRAHKQKHHKRQRRKTIDFNRFLQHDASSSMNYQRRVSNFTSHLQDSECLLRLTHRIFPSIKEQTIHEAMIHIDLDLRARSTLDIIKRQNPESAATASILQPHYIVNATHPDLVACFVTKLCADHFSVPLEGPWFQKTHPVNVKAKKKATESKSSSFSSDDILDTDDEDNHGTGHGSGSGGSGNGHTKGSGGGASEDVSDKSSRGNKIKDCERYGPLSQMIDEVAAIKSALDKSARVQRRVITEVPNRVPVMMERARNVLSDAYERYEVWKRIKARLRGLTLKLFMRRIDKKPLIMIDYKLIKKMLRWTNFLTASGSPLSFLHDMASMTAILPSASIASSLSSSSTDSSSSSSGGGKAGSHRSHSLSATPSASTSSSSFSKGDGSESASQRLALELIRCKKIIYMYFAEIRDVWQLYAQIDAQVTVKGGAVQNANKMNALEFWRLVSDIKISSKTFKAKDIYKLFTLVLKHRRKNSRGERGKNIGKEMRKSILLNYQRENNQDKSKPVSMSVLKDDHYGPVQAASGQPISGLHSDDEDGKGHYRSSSSTGAGPSTSRALCAKEDSEIDEAQFMELLVRIAGSLVITPSLRKQTYSEYRNLLNEFSDYENNHLELGPVLQAPEMRKADLLPVSTFLASSSSSLAPSGKDIPLSIRFFALIKLRVSTRRVFVSNFDCFLSPTVKAILIEAPSIHVCSHCHH